MARVLCVLYPDPLNGYPPRYARATVPAIASYPGGQRMPSPKWPLGFRPGELVGCVSGELGLRDYLEAHGHELTVISDKDGPDSDFDRFLPDADVVISQPFWPAYLTRDRISKAKNLKLALTAGIGSDHVDLQAASERGITVAEETFSNSISSAEHVVMLVLTLVRNYMPAYRHAVEGGWNIADCVSRSYDVEGMNFGTIGAGRIGLAVLRRLKAFDMPLHYHDSQRLSPALERELNVTYHATPQSLVKVCDVISLQTPLYPSIENMFDEAMFQHVKFGAYLINTARGKLCDTAAVIRALESGRLAGYGGDVWFPQPAPAEHPWRFMDNHGMTPHVSGSSLSAQARYAAGTLEILQCFLEGRPIRREYLILDEGKLAGAGVGAYRLT